MIFLNRMFSEFENIEVYEYFDRPLLFSFKLNEDLYFALLVEEDKNEFWYVVPVTSKRFNEAVNGFIDIYSLFKKSETNEVHLLGVTYNNNYIYSEHLIKSDTIRDENLPEKGEMLI